MHTNYVADGFGYRVASNDLPSALLEELKPVEDTPEVAEAKAKFFADFEQAKNRNRREASTPEQTPASTKKLSEAAPIAPVTIPFPITRTITPFPYSSHVSLAYPTAFAPYAYPFHYSYPIVI